MYVVFAYDIKLEKLKYVVTFLLLAFLLQNIQFCLAK